MTDTLLSIPPRLRVVDDELEIRPMSQAERQRAICERAWSASKTRPRHVALHCAGVTIVRQPAQKSQRLLPRPYVWLFGLTIVAIGAVLVAGAFAKAIRWAVT